MSDVAAGSGEIQDTVGEVTDAAQAASSGAEQTRGAARELAKMASDLEGLVGSFRY